MQSISAMLQQRGLVLDPRVKAQLVKDTCKIYFVYSSEPLPTTTLEDNTLPTWSGLEIPEEVKILVFVVDNCKSLSKSSVEQIVSRRLPNHLMFFSSMSLYGSNLLKPYRTEMFSFDDICFNNMEHSMVPRYVVLTENEIVEIEMCHKILRSKFPVMRSSDAIARYLGLETGCVVLNLDYQSYRIIKK